MPQVNVSRANNQLPTLTREDVKPGQIFAVIGKKSKSKMYANIGKNGRLYSINLQNGELASTAKGDSKVNIVGKFTYGMKLNYDASRVTIRAEVRPGEVFRIRGGEELYAHQGRCTLDKDGYLSTHLNGKMNHAVSQRGDSAVEIVGNFTIEAQVV